MMTTAHMPPRGGAPTARRAARTALRGPGSRQAAALAAALAAGWWCALHSLLPLPACAPYPQPESPSLEGLTLRRGWTPLPDAPAGFMEGAAVLAGDGDAWFLGGAPETGAVWIFSTARREWRAGPSLPLRLHHCLHCAFAAGGRVVVVGGMQRLDAEGEAQQRHDVNSNLLVFDTRAPGQGWQVVEAPGVGGITSCTHLPLDGRFFCYAGEDGNRVLENFAFFAVDAESLEVFPLASPLLDATHVTLILDAAARRVYCTGGRQHKRKRTEPRLQVYDVDADAWAWSAEAPLAPVESRVLAQAAGGGAVLLAGGQVLHYTNWTYHVADPVLRFDLRTQSFAYVADLPYALHGAGAVHLGGSQFLVAGGSVGTGDRYTRAAYVWDAAPLLEPHARELTGGGLRLVSALCGPHPVTALIAARMAAGEFVFRASLCKEDAAVAGAGAPLVPAVLTIVFWRDGALHVSACDDYNSCKVNVGV